MCDRKSRIYLNQNLRNEEFDQFTEKSFSNQQCDQYSEKEIVVFYVFSSHDPQSIRKLTLWSVKANGAVCSAIGGKSENHH